MKIEDINAQSIKNVDDKELLSLHHRLHQLAPAVLRDGKHEGLNWEDLVNAHTFVVNEMIARGMNHNIRDKLDEEYERLKKALPQEYVSFEQLPNDIVVVPDFVCLVGSTVEGDNPNDIDILFRANRVGNNYLIQSENVWLPLRKVVDPAKNKVLHFIDNPQGAHADFIPLYDLILRRKSIFEVHPIKAMKNQIIKEGPIKVDLGCGSNKPDGYIGIDKEEYPGVDIVYDLEEGIPLPDDYADEIRAWHILEHLSDKEAIMAEIWRVLKPGGQLVFEVPSTKGEGAFAHPEHKSFWNKASFYFWSQDNLLEDRPKFDIVELEEFAGDDNGITVYARGILRKPLSVELGKETLKPIARFPMQKPAMKLYHSQTEAFSPDEIWPWVEEHLKNGIVAELKLNGFRSCIQKAGDKVSIFFEDSEEERNKQLPVLVEELEKIPDDFILDCNVGIEENGKPWPRVKLMTLTADEPVVPEDAYPKVTVFDLLYWNEDVHERPFAERRKLLEEFYNKYLKGNKYFDITEEMTIKTKDDLEKAWDKYGSVYLSEGIVLKDLFYPFELRPDSDGLAKIKHAVEVKAIVLDVKQNKNGTYGFRGGLLPGESEFTDLIEFRGQKYVDMGFSFNCPFKAEPGDIVTFEVEEIIIRESNEGLHLDWLGANPIDIDKTRTEPYFANQVIDIARRGGVLQDTVNKVFKPIEQETRAEAAENFWKENWWKSYPSSGKGAWTFQHHWRGLSEEEAKLPEEELLKTDHSVHGDLRLENDSALWGVSVFIGTAEANLKAGGDRLVSLPPDDNLQCSFKLWEPKEWLDVGDPPLVVEPGGVGSTSKTWAKFFKIDSGTYEVGVWREHMIEIFLHGKKLNGRYLLEYAPVGGNRIWIIDKPKDQTPYAESHNLDDVVKELKQKGQKYLVWSKPGEKPKLIEVNKMSEKREWFIPIVKINEDQRFVLAPFLVPNEIDKQGDLVKKEDIEAAVHKFMEDYRNIGLMHQEILPDDKVKIVECYVTRGDWKIGDHILPEGTAMLGLKIYDNDLWQAIKDGKITGLSIRGIASAREV